MKAQFIYSVAALATFPIVVNASVEADNIGKITAAKDGTAWTKNVELAPGKYTFKNTVLATGTANKKAKVEVLDGATPLATAVEVKVGEVFTIDFTLTATKTVTFKVTNLDNQNDFVADGASVILNFEFTKVAQLLFIEYNKVTSALSAAEYTGKAADAAKYSELYDRIMAIQGADYDFYKADTEGLQAIYDKELGEADVQTLDLYSDIQDALTKVQTNEKNYQLAQLNGGNDGLNDLNARYNTLQTSYVVNYVTTALTTKRTAALDARDAYANDPTAEKLQAAKDARAAYKTEVVKEEGVAAKNETAKTNLDAALKAVYDPNNQTGYYKESLTQIDAQYKDANDVDRYSDLKGELKTELANIVGGTDYTSVFNAIKASYEAKTADGNQTTLGVQIQQFKQKLTVTITNYNAKKDDLAAAYATYDSEKTAADNLVKDAADFLIDDNYKKNVVDAVTNLKSFIDDNDTFDKIANLTKANISTYSQAITAAKETYTEKAAIYADYLVLKAAVDGEDASLNTVKTDIDNDAKDDKHLPVGDFKPTTLWASTISDIVNKIGALEQAVETNKKDATAFKDKNEYKNSLSTIQTARTNLKTNALAATVLFADYYGKLKAAQDALDKMNDTSKDPKVDFTALSVWANQVTIDEAAKKRTPYKNFLEPTNGSIDKANNVLVGKLDVMNDNTGPLTSFQGTVLDYLKTDAVKNAVKAVTDGSALMTEIANNYQGDEDLFAQQMDIQICEGLRTNINAKAGIFEGIINPYMINIQQGVYGNVKGALLKAEFEAITKKINDAKAVADNAEATKAQLTEAYNSIKNLNDDGKDIKTAQAHALAYAQAYQHFEDNYAEVMGKDNDESTESTIAGLEKKFTELKGDIDGLTELSAAQKSALKDKVQAVTVVKKEGNPQEDVTYSLANLKTILAEAKANEELTDDAVTKYQGIIEELKTVTAPVMTQATRLNGLETNLHAINFAKAKVDVLKEGVGDPNTDGYYNQLLIGETTAGQYTYEYNTLKDKIERDTDITSDEVTSYNNEITALKDLVDGVAAKAKDNLDAYEAAKKAYNFIPEPGSNETAGALQRWEEAMEKLEACPSSELENQKAVINTLKDALDKLGKEDAKKSYDEGKAKADGFASQINNKIKEIEEKVAEYTNPVNYSAQVATDNLAMKNAIKAAHDAADVAYAKASAAINTCKNFKSTDLKDATTAAATELQALLDYLKTYEKTVGDIQNEADATYAATISPAFFDKDGEYKKQIEDIKGEIETLTKALSDKVREAAAAKVTATINSYSGAISFSRGKVAKFSAGNDLTEDELNVLFSAIDAMQKAIVDNNVENADITALDVALARAEGAFVQTEGEVGIAARIVTVEQDQAQTALKAIIVLNTNSDLLTGNDKTLFNTIKTAANSTSEDKKKQCVNKFSTWKGNLNDLKTTADRLAAEKAAKEAAETAIDNANGALDDLIADYQKFAAGYQVKETVEQIAADLAPYDKTKVTPSNAAEWKTAAEGISERIEAAYVALYDFEVPVLEGLIDKAKEELVTYSKPDKATISANVTTEETNLNDVKTAVAKAPTAPGYKTKKSALLNDLKSIETNLYTEITKLTEGNQTNINQAIIDNLNNLIAVEQGRMTTSLKLLNVGANDKYYTPVVGALKYYQVTSAINSEKNAIEGSIDNLNDYIADHEDQIVSYEANAKAMLEDIKAAVTTLERNVSLEVEKQYNKFVADDNTAINNAKNAAQAKVTAADGQIARLVEQLGYYESSSKYANKINYLNAQLSDATGIMSDAIDAADATDVLKDKYEAFIDAQDDINTALAGVQANCNEIEGQAKAAYIDAFIANLEAQIIANTWTGSTNYTETDQTLLSNKWNALKLYVNTTLKNLATGRTQAEDLIGSKGVISTLNDGAVKFADDLAALKQLLKDLSLVEDVKGHISGNDDISIDDLEDLADIILNAQEESADMERCDISGDGTVDVTDLVWLRYFLVHDEWPNSAATARGDMASANDYINMEVVSVENNVTRIAINLDNETVFNHFQLNVQLPEGAKVVGQTLGERVEGANLMMAQNGTTVRMLAISTANNVFAGNEGAVVYIDIEGLNGEVNIEKAIFTDTELNGHLLTANSTTSIRESITNALQAAGQKIYNMGGKMMNGLKKGVNIIRNADGSTKKVMK